MKKAQLGGAQAVLLGLVIIAITASVTQQILGTMDDDLTAGSYEINATADGQSGIDKVSNWLPTIGLIVGAVIVLGLVTRGLK